MECNKDEAIRVRDMAKQALAQSQFELAFKYCTKASSLFSDVEGVGAIHTVARICKEERPQFGNAQSDWYKILNVDPAAELGVIKRAFHQLAKAAHPDKTFGLPMSDHAFGLVKKAFDVLRDTKMRNSFDLARRQHLRMNATAGLRGSGPTWPGFGGQAQAEMRRRHAETFAQQVHQVRMQQAKAKKMEADMQQQAKMELLRRKQIEQQLLEQQQRQQHLEQQRAAERETTARRAAIQKAAAQKAAQDELERAWILADPGTANEGCHKQEQRAQQGAQQSKEWVVLVTCPRCETNNEHRVGRVGNIGAHVQVQCLGCSTKLKCILKPHAPAAATSCGGVASASQQPGSATRSEVEARHDFIRNVWAAPPTAETEAAQAQRGEKRRQEALRRAAQVPTMHRREPQESQAGSSKPGLEVPQEQARAQPDASRRSTSAGNESEVTYIQVSSDDESDTEASGEPYRAAQEPKRRKVSIDHSDDFGSVYSPIEID